MPRLHPVVRNSRLLLQSALQHLVDDPALLAVQVSRRLPFSLRLRTGDLLDLLGTRAKFGHGVAALGAYIKGDLELAEGLLERSSGRRSALRDEVAVLIDRPDLLAEESRPATRARAAWSTGDLKGALRILEDGGAGETRYAQRLRSEVRLLEPGGRLHRETQVGRASEARTLEGPPWRVLHLITNSLPHTQSGYSLRTHRLLTSLTRHGVESVVLTRTGYPVMLGAVGARVEDCIDGIRYVRTLPTRLSRTQEGRLVDEVGRALQLVDEFRPNMVHSTTNYLNALVAQEVAHAAGLPWVLEVRGLMEQTWVASRRTRRARDLAATSEKWAALVRREASLARAADAVVTLSGTMAEALADRGVPREKIFLVPNGVEAELFRDHMDPRQARSVAGADLLPGIDEDSFVVGAVSAIVDYEGFDVLLRAVALLVRDEGTSVDLRRRLRVVIAGDGAARPSLAKLADELEIDDIVHLPGRVPRKIARRWVESLDLVAVPRLDREVTRTVTPQKPVEAMALGRFVIASDLPALREVMTAVDGTVHGTLIAPESPRALAEAITAIHDDPVKSQAAVRAARITAEGRTWDAVTAAYHEIYRQAAFSRSEAMT